MSIIIIISIIYAARSLLYVYTPEGNQTTNKQTTLGKTTAYRAPHTKAQQHAYLPSTVVVITMMEAP